MKRTVLFAVICFISIKGITQDYKKIASEYCDCFGSIKDSLHHDFIRYIVAAADSSNFPMKLEAIIPHDNKDYVQTLYSAIRRIKRSMFDPTSEVGKCGAELKQKYYSYQFNEETEKQFFTRIIKELEGDAYCSFYVAILKSMYLQTAD